MSKSKLKPEDIFFDLQKGLSGNGPKKGEEAAAKDSKSVERNPARNRGADRGPSAKKGANPGEKARRVPVYFQMKPETKYAMKTLIEEIKYHGYVEKYTMADFVNEAIEEKIQRDRERFDLN